MCEKCVLSGKDSEGRLTKSSAIGRKTRNGLVADRPLVSCNVMPILEMLLMMGVIIFNSIQIACCADLLTYSG